MIKRLDLYQNHVGIGDDQVIKNSHISAQDPNLDLICLVHALLAILIVAVLEQLVSCLPPRHQLHQPNLITICS